MSEIVKFKIHPSIGIARLGNSPDQSFIGPEIPGLNLPPQGGYKDRQMQIKRQAARFRIFGYDANGRAVKEITTKDAAIQWSVQLANKKAAWKRFEGLNHNTSLRNAEEKNRSELIIDPGERTLNKINTSVAFDTGKFYDRVVPLGEMRMEKDGHLLVLGGFGHSSSPFGISLINGEYANNDGWHDDVSDGPVTAIIKLKGSSKHERAMPAWVICPPPDFAPPIGHVISLYDTLLQVAINRMNYCLPEIPSFTKDIYPLLKRANHVQWVSMMMWEANQKHSSTPKSMESKHRIMDDAMPLITDDVLRKKVFAKLTDPKNPLKGEANDMPMMWSDYYHDETRANGEPRNQALCEWQYDYLEKWANGLFNNDWIGSPVDSNKITPHGLDKAALENCIGGPFYPGIEAGWSIRDLYGFSEPFRLSHSILSAGDITKQMALPWQADFFDCQQDDELAWWPAQRPDKVFIDDKPKMHTWTRKHVHDYQTMVKNWYKLGFVIKKDGKYIETERNS